MPGDRPRAAYLVRMADPNFEAGNVEHLCGWWGGGVGGEGAEAVLEGSWGGGGGDCKVPCPEPWRAVPQDQAPPPPHSHGALPTRVLPPPHPTPCASNPPRFPALETRQNLLVRSAARQKESASSPGTPECHVVETALQHKLTHMRCAHTRTASIWMVQRAATAGASHTNFAANVAGADCAVYLPRLEQLLKLGGEIGGPVRDVGIAQAQHQHHGCVCRDQI